MVYCVFVEGVYRHECLGVYAQADLVRDCAIKAAQADMDDYHSYTVVPFDLNVAMPKVSEDCFLSPIYQEQKEIFATKKDMKA